MISLLIALIGVFALILLGEYLRHVHLLHIEVTRKFIHISVGMFAATWPFFMSWNNIELMSLLMFAGILLSRYFHLFRAIHGVQRHTWGELFFAMSIGIAAVLSEDQWVFAAAMLVMGLADGLAALAGTLFKEGKRYRVFGHHKSRHGTLTFACTTFVILLICVVLNGPHESWTILLWLPIVAAALENVSVGGTDNLFVPLSIILLT